MSLQQQFIDLAIDREALSFGEFTLKSGRISPYFFNAGKLCDAQALSLLGKCYAATIANTGVTPDVLFGPAYKGISLGALAAAALADNHNMNPGFAYNRKEAKTHGEGGTVVGAAIKGDVIIIDDVITAGTAIREAIKLISDGGARVAGVVIGLDRQERGQGQLSAIGELEAEGISVHSIVKLDDVLAHLSTAPDMQPHYQALCQYREEYGI